MQQDLRRLCLLLVVLIFMSITACSTTPADTIIQGKVLKGTTPVPDLTIQLSNDGETVETQTDDEGNFVFHNVVAGTRSLSVTTTFGERSCTSTKTILNVEAGDTVTADIKLPKELKPPEANPAGGVGYLAGDLTIIC